MGSQSSWLPLSLPPFWVLRCSISLNVVVEKDHLSGQIAAIPSVESLAADDHRVAADCYAGNLHHRLRDHTVGRPALASGEQHRVQ
jgi:hypothetical protein